LYTTEKLERWMNPSQMDQPLLFADTALNSLAIMCAEGKALLINFNTVNKKDISSCVRFVVFTVVTMKMPSSRMLRCVALISTDV
jgi:hypothetical protein